MRFDRLEGYLARLPLKEELRYADAPISSYECVLVKLSSEGVSGWSEVYPGNSPLLTPDWSGATYLTLRDCVAPICATIKGAASSRSLSEAFQPLKGSQYAKAAVEMAWQDLNARQQGVPLWKALGGEKNPIKVGLTFDRTLERERFFAALARANEDQFARITLKMRPGWDVQVVNFARIDSPAHLQIQVDVEGALDFDQHADTLYRMDDFFLTFVEQPLNPRDFVQHAQLAEALRTPICLDESILSLEDAKIAFDLGSCSVVNMKPDRVGGLDSALEISKFVTTWKDEEKGTTGRCFAGCELLSSLGYRSLLAFASAARTELPTDYIRFDETFECDLAPSIETRLIEEPADEEKGRPPRSFRYVDLWDEPGLGVDPSEEVLAKYTLDKFEIRF